MSDVALAAGVSKNTVSLALRGDRQIPERTRARIAGIAKRMGYRRNPVVGELMARLHAGGVRRFRSTLALINGNRSRAALSAHPTIPVYVRGCRQRASELGYGLDDFWLHDPALSPERWVQVLRARGISGGIIVGLMDENRLPATILPAIREFPFVVTGVRTREPELSFACTDHHMVAVRAFEKVLELGWRRPGLVLDPKIDALVEHRFSAGYRTGQEAVPAARRLKPFTLIEAARRDREIFRDWLRREKPDAIFCLYREVKDWIEECGWRVPENVALIQYEWREDAPDWPGMNQHNDLAGQAAVDMLVGMIHRAEKGPPPFPMATLISPTWVEARGRTPKLTSGP